MGNQLDNSKNSCFENGHEGMKKKLAGIESEIKRIAGRTLPVAKEWNDAVASRLEELLRERASCLDAMFIGSEAELKRFSEVNDSLHRMTDAMYRKMAREYRALLTRGADDFDDDCVLHGTLCFNYNAEDSISRYSGDDDYGSDFAYMIDLIDAFCHINEVTLPLAEATKSYDQNDNPCMTDAELGLGNDFDSVDWYELKSLHPCLGATKICCAVNNACVCKLYSLIDLLLLDDFSIDVTVGHQHFGKVFTGAEARHAAYQRKTIRLKWEGSGSFLQQWYSLFYDDESDKTYGLYLRQRGCAPWGAYICHIDGRRTAEELRSGNDVCWDVLRLSFEYPEWDEYGCLDVLRLVIKDVEIYLRGRFAHLDFVSNNPVGDEVGEVDAALMLRRLEMMEAMDNRIRSCLRDGHHWLG